MPVLIVVVIGLLAIVGAATLGPRLGVAAPLLLVLVGIVASLLPFVPNAHIDPEWILAGVLPPLLYSASVSMPTMDFRREFGAISGLSVLLVVISSVLLGLFFTWIIPGISLPWGIALGAIVSPTDAVATSIIKKTGVSPRVVALLEGESLLNDATALVLLRSAIAGAAAAISVWGVIGQFVYAVVIAVVIGYIVGKVNLIVRSHVRDATVNTVISFTVPFIASIPAEALGASGLVAAVAAGFITGRGAARKLSPQHRMSDTENWHTIELVLEGIVFLTMGLQLAGIVEDVQKAHAGLLPAIGIAAAALLLTIAVRTGFVAPLLAGLRVGNRRQAKMKPRFETIQTGLEGPNPALPTPTEALELGSGPAGRRGGPIRRAATTLRRRAASRDRKPTEGQLELFRTRLRRAVADIDYFLAEPLGWREGTIVVWAGMRGAVTVAAAQTLPIHTPNRSLLVLIAFVVAAGSLLIQGGTMGRVIRWVKPKQTDPRTAYEERMQIMQLLREASSAVAHTGLTADDRRAAAATGAPAEGADVVASTGAEAVMANEAEAHAAALAESESESESESAPESAEALGEAETEEVMEGRHSEQVAELMRERLSMIQAQRLALLDARDDGVFSASALSGALAALDADQISLELRGLPPGEEPTEYEPTNDDPTNNESDDPT